MVIRHIWLTQFSDVRRDHQKSLILLFWEEYTMFRFHLKLHDFENEKQKTKTITKDLTVPKSFARHLFNSGNLHASLTKPWNLRHVFYFHLALLVLQKCLSLSIIITTRVDWRIRPARSKKWFNRLSFNWKKAQRFAASQIFVQHTQCIVKSWILQTCLEELLLGSLLLSIRS